MRAGRVVLLLSAITMMTLVPVYAATYRNETVGFSIYYPETWEQVPVPDVRRVSELLGGCLKGQMAKAVLTNISHARIAQFKETQSTPVRSAGDVPNLVIEFYPYGDRTPDFSSLVSSRELIHQKLEAMREKKLGYRSSGEKETTTTLAGRPAVITETELHILNVKHIEAILDAGVGYFSIMCNAPPHRYQEVKPLCEKMINSFTLL